MDDWSVLGGSVRLDLGDERTVLVGRNAAGKSILLESILLGSLGALFNRVISSLGPGHMCFEFCVTGVRLAYSYTWKHDSSADADSGESSVLWEEHCEYLDPRNEIWRVVEGVAHLSGGRQMVMPPENGLLRIRETPALSLPPEVSRVRKLVRGIRLVRAGVPRHEYFRGPMSLFKYRKPVELKLATKDHRSSHTMAALVDWSEDKKDLFESVTVIGRRLDLLSNISVSITEEKSPPDQPNPPTHTATVLVDGVDFGYLSDGTLRVLEIIVGLVDPNASVILIEEPETAIHPGLLRRLLAEIEAHAINRQVVVTTHSPLIVDWAKPEDVRLVERASGRTQVRALNTEELQNVAAYLEDNLTLSDFLYSRSSE
jgi:hypothetical protein